MALVKRFYTAYDIKSELRNCDRDYYSIEALEHILDFYDEFDEDIHFDACAFCGDWSEYDSYEDLYSDYGREEYSTKEEFLEYVEYNTYCATIEVGGDTHYLIQPF